MSAGADDPVAARARAAGMHRLASMRAALQRAARVMVREPALRASTSTKEELSALREHASSIALIVAAFERFADRPCLGSRERDAATGTLLGGYRVITYGALWSRVVSLASALVHEGVAKAGDHVALLGFGSEDWVVAELACLYLGAISVPLPTSLGAADLTHILSETGARLVLASRTYARALEPLAAELDAVVLLDENSAPADEAAPLAAELAAWRAGLRVHAIDALIDGEKARAPIAAAPRTPEAIVTLSYTSGSTGHPKGVLYPDARWLQRMREALAEAPLPHVTVGYLSLAQMGGRLTLLRSLVTGGTHYFAASPDLSTLLDDIRLARPTFLMLIPRVSGLIHQAFQLELLRAGGSLDALDSPEARATMASMRERFLGDRLCLVTTGAAPTAPEVLEFLERCFEVSVINAYGATELGTVALNGHVRPDIEYKLADVPELGYTTRDRPYPRGELLVKSPYKAPGYFNNEQASRLLSDEEGYARSGDIVEERGPRQLVWIDRRNATLRLAHGEFVSVARVEEALCAGGPFIAQAFVHGDPLRAYVLAVLVPNTAAVAEELGRRGEDPASGAATRRLLRAEIGRIAKASSLRRTEIPRDFIVERRSFTRENGLLTESDKPRRPALKAAYEAPLASLYAEIERRQLSDVEALATAQLPADQKLLRAAFAVLGLDAADADELSGASFVGLGGDSAGAVRLAALVEKVSGAAPPVAAILDGSTSLARLATRLSSGALAFETLHGHDPRVIRVGDLTLDRVLPGAEAARALPLREGARRVLLTGANGFLGRALLLELAERSNAEIVCIARGTDDANARARVLDGGGGLGERRRAHAARIVVHAGDLALPRLGLAAAVHDELAETIDLVVHCGALVNHALGFRDLWEPNVLGTVEIMRLATTRARKPVAFVSSIGVAAGLRRQGPVREDESARALRPGFPVSADYGAGYSASKWAGEVLLDELTERCAVPVQIFRCGLVLADRRDASQINETDLFARLLVGLARTRVRPPSFYAAGVHAGMDGMPVDFVAGEIVAHALARDAAPRLHLSNSEGPSFDDIADWMTSAGLVLERCATHAEWFARFSGSLGQLDDAERRRTPFPVLARWSQPIVEAGVRFDTTRLRASLAARGEATPPVDEAFVHACLRGLGLGA